MCESTLALVRCPRKRFEYTGILLLTGMFLISQYLGYAFRGESIPKPDLIRTLYDRIPKHGFIVFDILNPARESLSYEEMQAICRECDLECAQRDWCSSTDIKNRGSFVFAQHLEHLMAQVEQGALRSSLDKDQKQDQSQSQDQVQKQDQKQSKDQESLEEAKQKPGAPSKKTFRGLREGLVLHVYNTCTKTKQFFKCVRQAYKEVARARPGTGAGTGTGAGAPDKKDSPSPAEKQLALLKTKYGTLARMEKMRSSASPDQGEKSAKDALIQAFTEDLLKEHPKINVEISSRLKTKDVPVVLTQIAEHAYSLL